MKPFSSRLLTIVIGTLVHSVNADPIFEGFQSPPLESRPETWFHLISGNVKQSALTTDLEAVKAAGLQGIQLFHGSGRPWPGVKPQIQTLSPAWDSMISHVADETQRLGLKFTMQNCPGWAMSGGPWITPDKAMRHIVWSRSEITGDSELSIDLTKPQPSKEDWRNYQDIAVLAFPTPEGDTGNFLSPRAVASNLKDVSWNDLLAEKKDSSVKIPVGREHTWIAFEFDEPTSLRSIELPPIELLMARRSFVPESRIRIQAMKGLRWQDLVSHEIPYGNWQDRQPEHPFVLSVPDALSKRYRMVFENKHRMNLSYLRLSSTARVHDWRAQAGFALRKIHRSSPPENDPKTIIAPSSIIDLSNKLEADGKLAWTAPPGQWTILRFGHVNTGVKNKPAPPEATGFECDKLSAAGADQHFAGYIGRISADGGPADQGRLKGMLIDSWECYTQTWTPAMEKEFTDRRGYPLRDWLPALAGYIVHDRSSTERFLRDWRATISDLLVDNYFGRLAELARERDMKLSFETAIGDVSPGDILRYQGKADIPMCEFWKPNDPHWGGYETKPVHPTVSAAHIYGKARIAAEAFTNIDHDWSDHPFSFKHMADRNFALGINHLVFHTYTHNPMDELPGTSFGSRIGSPFIRGQTWWNYMPLFTDYLARCQHLLQLGQPVADVLWYLGDDLDHKPRQDAPFPKGYDFDYLNQDVLLNRLEVVDGTLRTPEGTSWQLIWLPEEQCRRLSPTTLERLKQLITDGATIIGGPPLENPSLVGGKTADSRFKALVDELWAGQDTGDRQIGKGRLLWGQDLEEGLATLGIQPDLKGLRKLAWNHRRSDDTEIYFICADRATSLDATLDFRATGRPEFWDPLTNTTTPVAVYEKSKGRTQIPVQLPAAGSLFVIFRPVKSQPAFTKITHNESTLIDATDTTRRDQAAPYPHLALMPDDSVQPTVSPQPPKIEFINEGTKILIYDNGIYQFTRADGTTHEITSTKAVLIPIETPWTLSFPEDRVKQAHHDLAKLAPWSSLAAPDARAYSGTATYRTELESPELTSDRRTILDLGQVENIAEIIINGNLAAILWAPPFRTDITDHLKPGKNRIEIKVTNTWHNRLAYDESLPKNQRKTWTLSGPKKDSPIKPAGLIGPAVIRIAESTPIAP
ncbi:glycosyl hydrolase [Haloferula chungangensis]|uniref:Glycosyl hydrolase n=1 Tax=Haloferula chungangensis TaxID=1048331 RepID=A0ABW2L0U2_9BACT